MWLQDGLRQNFLCSRRNSEVQNLTGIINSSTRRNSYVNPYNGESIEWEERKMDYKVCNQS